MTARRPARRARPATVGRAAGAGGAMTPAAAGVRPAVPPPLGGSRTQRVLAGVLVPVLTIVIVVIGLRVPGRSGLLALQAVAFGLVVVGALLAAVLGRAPERVPLWQAALGPLAAAAALPAARIGSQARAGQHHAARGVATLGVLSVIAIWVHLLLALPEGGLRSRSRLLLASLAYAAAAAAGLGLATAGQALTAGAVALIWPLAAVWALPAGGLGYRAVAWRDRERMQWMSVGAVLAADTALVAVILHVLVGWPEPVAAVAAGCAIF